MNMTSEKFWNGERERLNERRDALRTEANTLNDRLTEVARETALLDDVIRRLGAHLADTVDVVAIRETA